MEKENIGCAFWIGLMCLGIGMESICGYGWGWMSIGIIIMSMVTLYIIGSALKDRS